MLVDISTNLRQVLRDSLPQEVPDQVEIGGLDGDGSDQLQNKLILYLYSVGEDPFTRNRSLVRHESGGYKPPKMQLTLQYLITFLSDDQKEVQRRLASVLQIFFDKPRIGAGDLSANLLDQVEYLTVRLLKPSLDELNQLWTALNQSMRLSLYYEVNAALIGPQDFVPVPQIIERHIGRPGDAAS